MPLACEVSGCEQAAGSTIKGYGFCEAHSDDVIDRLREQGHGTREATAAQVLALVKQIKVQ